MATSRSRDPSSDDIVDSTPFITNSGGSSDELNSGRRFVRRQSLRQAARFLRQASGRRMMREPSMLVRETAAEQLEERQGDWAYSKPVVILDIIWNFVFVVGAATILILSRSESPSMPLRLWIVGYALQCILHVFCVCVEYRRRRRLRRRQYLPSLDAVHGRTGSGENLSPSSRDGSGHYVTLAQFNEEGSR